MLNKSRKDTLWLKNNLPKIPKLVRYEVGY